MNENTMRYNSYSVGKVSDKLRSGEVNVHDAPAEDSRRERMLRMKKSKQAAAMERMCAAQAKFAPTIGEEDAIEDRGAEPVLAALSH